MRWSKLARYGLFALILRCSSALADETAEFDEKQLAAAGVGLDGPALLAYFKNRTLTDADRPRLEKLVRQLGHNSYKQRQQASRDLIAHGWAAIPILKPALDEIDLEVSVRAQECLTEIRRAHDIGLTLAAARQLARRAPEGAAAVLLDYLPFADDEYVEEEVITAMAVKGMCDDKALPTLTKALDDPNALRRGAAGYVVGRMSGKDAQAVTAKLLADADVKVRLRACQGLLAGGNRSAADALIQLIGIDGEVGWQAEQVLFQLAGDRPPPLPAGSGPLASAKRQEAWRAWWRTEGAKLDLTKIQQEPPQLGFTLIAQVSAGKIWECARDGTVRWTLTGLQGPIEVRPLPGGRLLVTETFGQCVSERKLDGTIIWQAKTHDAALSAQRLPGGNTFIATNYTMSEVDRAGKEVYCYNFANMNLNGRFEGGCKTRDGRILAGAGADLVEIEASTGKVLKKLTLPYSGFYGVEELRGGHRLLTSYNNGKVVEIDSDGKVIWSYDLPTAFQATRLPNGNTLMTSHGGKKVLEVTRDKKVVWERAMDDHVWRAYRR